MQVGPALLIEYTAPAAVVVLALAAPRPAARTGHPGRRRPRRPRARARPRPAVRRRHQHRRGALGARGDGGRGVVLRASPPTSPTGCPPLTLAAGGLVAGTAALGLLGLVGLMPMRATTTAVDVRRADRRLVGPDDRCSGWSPPASPTPPASPPSAASGSRAGLLRGADSRCWPAWSARGCCSTSCPRPVQLLGGVLILAGVVAVKLGERTVAETEPVSA